MTTRNTRRKTKMPEIKYKSPVIWSYIPSPICPDCGNHMRKGKATQKIDVHGIVIEWVCKRPNCIAIRSLGDKKGDQNA
jgi:hypothetical protein